MEQVHYAMLQQADSAMARGDYLTAIRHALTASTAPRGEEELRCDAFLTLAQASLALGLPGEALEFAVGALLTAMSVHDRDREATANSVVSGIVAQHPDLGDHRIDHIRH